MCTHSNALAPRICLTPGERTTYTATIDDILADHGKAVLSGEIILEKLQNKFNCELTSRQRPRVKMLIMERIKQQPAPDTIAHSDDQGAGSSPAVASTAKIAVFNVPELLESILRRLPMEDLFVARRVNKAFYRLIETSPALQRQLFLLPGNVRPQYWQPVQNSVTGQHHAVAAPSSDIVSTLPEREVALGKPSIVVRINPLLKLGRYKKTSVMFKRPAPPLKVADSAFLDERILELNQRPHMYLTNPPCTCVHIDVDYDSAGVRHCEVLRIRRCVYDPAGVTFGAIYEALHAKGLVATYERRKFVWFEDDNNIAQNTTLREQLRLQVQDGYDQELIEPLSMVEFCHVAAPSDAEFEEMGRTGRIEVPLPPPDAEENE